MVDKYSKEEEDSDEDAEEDTEEEEEDEASTQTVTKPANDIQGATYTSGFSIGGLAIILIIVGLVGHFLGVLAGAIVLVVVLLIALGLSLKTVEQTERGLIERFGKYNRYAEPGLVFLIPFIEALVKVNVTETLKEVDGQEILTLDSLNAFVDAQIYYKIKPDKTSVYNSQYNVNDVHYQAVQLARTTLRAIIGSYSLKDANTKRNKLNEDLARQMNAQIVQKAKKSTEDWGIQIVRAEIKDVKLPADVAESLDNVVKQENAKIAAKFDADRKIAEAEGDKQSQIKLAEALRQSEILKAEGFRQAEILNAEGKAQAIKLVNDMTNKTFTPRAQMYKKYEVTQRSLEHNTKVVIAKSSGDLMNIIGDTGSIVPVKQKKTEG